MRQELTPPDQATFHPTATPSGPHSQHPWWCRKYDAIPSLCLSPHRWQLEDHPCSMTDGLSEVRDLSILGLVAAHETRHIRALSSTRPRVLSATLRSWMLDAPPTLAQGN